MSYIYLASPYTHPDHAVMEARYKEVAEHTAQMLREGLHVFSPIVHCHKLAVEYGLPRHIDFWEAYNTTMLRVASKLLVLQIEGWEDSRGIRREITLAGIMRIPIQHTRLLPLKGD